MVKGLLNIPSIRPELQSSSRLVRTGGMASTPDLKTYPNWVKKMEVYFKATDNNKDGVLTIEEILKTSTKIRDACKATPGQMKNLHDALVEFWGGIGLVPGDKLNKQQFIEGVSQLGRDELVKKGTGETTLHDKMSNAYFDVMDVNNDGTVSPDEFKTVMVASGMDPEGCEPWFNSLDKNKDGVVDRKELLEMGFDFWFRPEDEGTKGLF